MNLLESFRIALRALNANKVRSALTMLGVIIGVAAVILLVSLGTGVQSQITGQIAGLGSNILFALPGDLAGGGGGGGGEIVKQFTLGDVQYLRTRLGPENTVIPELQAAGEVRATNKRQSTQIVASDENAKDAAFGNIATGRWFSRGEVVGASRVAVLGISVRDKLFPGQDPVGRTIDINGTPFRVIGQLETRGGGFGGSQDNLVIIPISTAQQLLRHGQHIRAARAHAGRQEHRCGQSAGRDGAARALLRHVHRDDAGADAELPLDDSRARSPRCSRGSPRSRCWSAASAS